MIKLSPELLQQLALFGQLTKAHARDVLPYEGGLLFIVAEDDLEQALDALPKVERVFKKKIFLLGYSSDLTTFINHLLYPLTVHHIKVDGTTVYITPNDVRDKGKIYGRSREHLRWMIMVIQRYFDVKDIQITEPWQTNQTA